MTLADQLLAEFEAESVTTRKFLSRLPEDRLDWQPHPKSMSAGQLALHIAVSPGQIVGMAQEDAFTMPEFRQERQRPASLREVMAALDESIATVRNVLPTFSDDRMHATWQVTVSGKLLSMPRSAMLRNILLNHWYHHRGQLGVYLRLLGASVPSSYGPSGDELPDFMNQ